MKRFLSALILATVVFTANALAQDSAGHSGQASAHSGQAVKNSFQAVGHGSIAGAKLTSGVIAIPFKVVGAVSTTAGRVSDQAGDDLWHAAAGDTFELTEQHFTTADIPPHEAIQE